MAHQAAEHIVHGIHHLQAAAEIPGQVDPHTAAPGQHRASLQVRSLRPCGLISLQPFTAPYLARRLARRYGLISPQPFTATCLTCPVVLRYSLISLPPSTATCLSRRLALRYSLFSTPPFTAPRLGLHLALRCGIPLCHRHPRALIAVIFFQEKLRSGQAELIDALLHVPHHEAVEITVRLAGYRFQQIFLHQVAVLIFIRQYLDEMLPVFQCHGAGAGLLTLPLQQDPQGEMLHVGEVYDFSILLFLLHPPVEFQHQVDQRAHRARACRSLPGRKLQRRGKIALLHVPDAVLHGGPHSFRKLTFYRGDAFILFRRQPAEAHGGEPDGIRLQGIAGGQGLQLLQLPVHQLPVHIRTVRGLAEGQHPPQLLHASGQEASQMLQEPAGIGAGAHLLH